MGWFVFGRDSKRCFPVSLFKSMPVQLPYRDILTKSKVIAIGVAFSFLAQMYFVQSIAIGAELPERQAKESDLLKEGEVIELDNVGGNTGPREDLGYRCMDIYKEYKGKDFIILSDLIAEIIVKDQLMNFDFNNIVNAYSNNSKKINKYLYKIYSAEILDIKYMKEGIQPAFKSGNSIVIITSEYENCLEESNLSKGSKGYIYGKLANISIPSFSEKIIFSKNISGKLFELKQNNFPAIIVQKKLE